MIEWENIKGTTILYHNTHSYLCLETIAKYVEGNYIKEPHKFGIHFAQTHTATIYKPSPSPSPHGRENTKILEFLYAFL